MHNVYVNVCSQLVNARKFADRSLTRFKNTRGFGFLKRQQQNAVEIVGITLVWLFAMSDSLLHFDIVQGHVFRQKISVDLGWHIQKADSLKDSLLDGQVLPLVAPNALDGFGASVNGYYPSLSHILWLAFRHFFHSDTAACAIFLSLILLLTGLAARYFVKTFFPSPSQNVVIISSAFYMLSPYVLICWWGGSFASYLSCAFFPLVIAGLIKVLNNERKGVLLLAFSAALIINTHILSTYSCVFVCVIFLIFNMKRIFKKSVFFKLCISAFFTIGLSALFVFPFFEQSKVGIYGFSSRTWRLGHKASYFSMFANHEVDQFKGLFTHSAFGTAFYPFIGFLFLIVFFAGVFSFSKRKEFVVANVKFYGFAIMLCAVGILFVTNTANWRTLPDFLTATQFSFRYLIFLSVAGVTLLVFILNKKDMKKFANLPLFIGVALTFLLLQIQPFFVDNPVYTGDSIIHPKSENLLAREGDPLPMDLPVLRSGVKHDEFVESVDLPKEIQTDAEIISSERVGTHWTVEVENTGDETVNLTLPQIYYPGYQAVFTGENAESENEVLPSFDEHGLIVYQIPAHFKGSFRSWFGLSLGQKLGIGVFFVSLPLFALFAIFTPTRRKKLIAKIKR